MEKEYLIYGKIKNSSETFCNYNASLEFGDRAIRLNYDEETRNNTLFVRYCSYLDYGNIIDVKIFNENSIEMILINKNIHRIEYEIDGYCLLKNYQIIVHFASNDINCVYNGIIKGIKNYRENLKNNINKQSNYYKIIEKKDCNNDFSINGICGRMIPKINEYSGVIHLINDNYFRISVDKDSYLNILNTESIPEMISCFFYIDKILDIKRHDKLIVIKVYNDCPDNDFLYFCKQIDQKNLFEIVINSDDAIEIYKLIQDKLINDKNSGEINFENKLKIHYEDTNCRERENQKIEIEKQRKESKQKSTKSALVFLGILFYPIIYIFMIPFLMISYILQLFFGDSQRRKSSNEEKNWYDWWQFKG